MNSASSARPLGRSSVTNAYDGNGGAQRVQRSSPSGRPPTRSGWQGARICSPTACRWTLASHTASFDSSVQAFARPFGRQRAGTGACRPAVRRQRMARRDPAGTRLGHVEVHEAGRSVFPIAAATGFRSSRVHQFLGMGSRALGTSSAAAGPRRPNPLLDDRRRSIVDVGRSVVGQALEIGPDQGFVGRWQAPALAAIELRGQHDDEFTVCLAVRNAPAVRKHDPVARASVAMTLARAAAWRRGLRPASRPPPAVVARGLRPVPPD